MTLIHIIIALVILGVIIMAHEAGHFFMGRACGIGVIEFSLGFGPKIVQWKGKETLYSIRCVPLGGYCRFVGEDARSEAPNAMNNQAVWKRFLTVLSGPLMNFVLGAILTVGLFLCFGISTTVPVVGALIDGLPAQESGMLEGDILREIDGKIISDGAAGTQEATDALQACDKERPVSIVVERDGSRVELEVPMTQGEDGRYQIGIYFGTRFIRYSLGETLSYSGAYIRYVLTSMLETLRNLIFRGEGIREVSGVVGIVAVMSEQISRGVDTVIYLVILISFNLGIMNLLPLPALDGGRLIFLIAEAIRGKPVPPEKEGMVHAIGLMALLILMVVIAVADVMRLM